MANVRSEIRTKPWDDTKKDAFNVTIDRQKFLNIREELYTGNNFDKQSINSIMTKIEELFVDTANSTLGTYTQTRSHKNKKNDTKWFDNDCRTARRKYHLARKIYATNKIKESYESLSHASKHYKNTMKKSMIKL